MDHNLKLIKKNCGHGGRSQVSIVRRESDGKLLIWKRPKYKNHESYLRDVDSFHKEIKRVKFWRKHGLSKIKISWHPDKESLLKTFINGHTLNYMLKKGQIKFSKVHKEDKSYKYIKALRKFVGKLIDSKYYIHDMKGQNLVWDGENWNIIDSGPIQKRLNRIETLNEYKKYLFTKWSKSIHSKKERHALKSFLNSF